MSILSTDATQGNTELIIAIDQVDCALHLITAKESSRDLDKQSAIYILEVLRQNLTTLLHAFKH